MIELNLLGILAATIAGMLLGALWYSPILFGKAWLDCIGETPATYKQSPTPIIGSIIANLLTAIGLGLLFAFFDIHDLETSIAVGTILGLLIIFPALLSDNLFCGWGNKLLAIQSGYRVISVFLMTIIMHFTH